MAVADLGRFPSIPPDLLVFRHENQGVCMWAVELNGSDDPPVVVDYDPAMRTPEPSADTFSDHVYAGCWDWGLVLRNTVIQAQNQPLSEKALAVLRRDFKSEVVTYGWPGDVQHRFFSADQRVLIWAGKDQADWWLAADSEDALRRLASALWEVDDLGRSLWSNGAVGERVLMRVRADARDGTG